MKKFLSVILFLFFLIFAGGITETIFSMNIEDIAAMSQQASDKTGYSDDNNLHNRLATAETNNFSQLQHGVNTGRVNRNESLQMSDFLKSLISNLSLHESVLAQHSEKLYTSTTHFNSERICEYYVFALRQIII